MSVAETADELEAQYDSPWGALAAERQARKELEAEKEQLESTVEGQQEHIGQLEGELEDYRAENELDKAQTKQRLTDVEETETTSEPENPGLEADKQDSTPMETILSLPDNMARRELNQTQYRGREIAERIQQHGKKVMDGLRLDSSDMRTILTALDRDGKTIYRQQVKRVLEFFKDVTRDDEIIVDKKRGRNFVIFTDELVERLKKVGTNGNIVRYGENGHGLLHTG